MRILVSLARLGSLAGLVLGLVGLASAQAADMPDGWNRPVAIYSQGGVRAPQLLIYDDQPGVYRRSYWREPWHGHHYYPFTGKKPKVGRHERLNAVRRPPKPAETYHREWSTSSDAAPVPPAALSDSEPRYVDPRYVDPRYRDPRDGYGSPYGGPLK